MSTTHLTTGSTQPPKVEGKLRLYSMEYCPYAHRARLVLLAKGVPHDIVNINLINKPDWYFKVHPEGKVPALDIGSRVVVESIDISNFLDDEYQNPPLYPSDPQAREQDKALIKKIGPLTDVFTKLILAKEKRPAEEWLKEFAPHLELFEEELKKRGSVFFNGEKPGMVDYMLWPWSERAGVIKIILGEQLPVKPNELPCLKTWRKAMKEEPIVAQIYHEPEKFYKVILFKTAGAEPDYDSI